jgi:hypothetical protein
MTPLLAIGPECCFLPPLMVWWVIYAVANAGKPPDPPPPPEPPPDPDAPPRNWPAHWPR